MESFQILSPLKVISFGFFWQNRFLINHSRSSFSELILNDLKALLTNISTLKHLSCVALHVHDISASDVV